MTVEIATKVSQLNVALPASGDSKSEGDDHIRGIKIAVLGTLTGADTTGVTGFNVVTQATADNSTLAASTAHVSAKVAAAAFSSALPSQAGNSGMFVTTDGSIASWAPLAAPTGSTLYLYSLYGAL